ncbi:MAG: hypothetical protein KJ941_09005, partial [Bacteroidetes bacterium]|nr:hypothetical protein [Bacteroidota bacterium]
KCDTSQKRSTYGFKELSGLFAQSFANFTTAGSQTLGSLPFAYWVFLYDLICQGRLALLRD